MSNTSTGSDESGSQERDLLAAQAGDERVFERLLAPYRTGIHRHCYRMLGDVVDSDDAAQETIVRAWRHLPRFEPRAPLRVWLYRIATNVCLTAIETRARRRDKEHAMNQTCPVDEALTHVTPFADPLLPEGQVDWDEPASRVAEDEKLQLAFVAAGQLLPPRQRAVLLLRDVLDFSAREVASMLETSPQAVNSALQRARASVGRDREEGHLAHRHAPASADMEADLARRFAAAWQDADIEGLVRLLADDALLTMPPQPHRVRGSAEVGSFLQSGPLADPTRRFATLPARLNDQPALAIYRDDPHCAKLRPYTILALAIGDTRIASVTRFADPRLFHRLGLPPHHDG